MKNIKNRIDKNKFNKLVGRISLCRSYIISGIPSGEVLILKDQLKSRKELSNYIFTSKTIGETNTLIANKNYSVKNA